MTCSPVSRSVLFALVSKNFMTAQVTTDMAEKHIIRTMAIVYLGPCDEGKK